eukprot:TRINITY_DN12067_c0_g1_i1.p1 TRINITY_DN12067_c0_g1~~TRINITY_DN12067_c0_g1_i1.p1  ORF type:complete len:446 (+),score=121.91 TRINITY_DN12067_c0_g1_i1:71-1339(+)
MSSVAVQRRCKHMQTMRSFNIQRPKLPSEWFVRAPYEPMSWSQRYGPDKGFFHRDNVSYTGKTAGNPWGFLYPGGKVQSPLWMSDPGIGSHEVAGTLGENEMDDSAYAAKMEHNHPETTWDHEPTPFGQFDFDFSKRSGMIGIKVGKTTQMDDYGNIFNANIVWCPSQHVISHFTPESDGFNAVTIAAHDVPDSKSPRKLVDACTEAGVPTKHVSKSFKVSEDAFIPIGAKMDVRHWVPGQLVTTVSRTTERGFQGAVKRWGFKGGPTRYGPRRSAAWHRRPGSLSSGESYGRVVKGKRMPGHMGGMLRTINAQWVWRVDYKNQLLYLLGPIPGPMGTYLTIEDSALKKFDYFFGAPPFPTFVPKENEDVSQLSWDECQLVSRSRIGFPQELGRMPSADLLDTFNYARKQKELLASENITPV